MKKSFEKICRMSQSNLKSYVERRLQHTHKEITVADGFVYAQGKFPVLLVAHLDTVHKALPNFILKAKDKDGNTVVSSPNGIGGDDRCGVYMIFEVLEKFNCSVLFCEDEEIGTVGAKKFTKHPLSKDLKFNYIIEFDRKGNNDAVFYDCDNEEFTEFITKEFFKEAYGSYSDISEVAPHLGCAAVNLSCGYYNAHTTNEYVVVEEMEKVIEETCKLLERTTDTDVYEYIEAKYYYRGSGGCYSYKDIYGDFGWYDEDYYSYGTYANEKKSQYYLITYNDPYVEDGADGWYETEASSEAEAVGDFLMKFNWLCYNDIVEVLSEEDCM